MWPKKCTWCQLGIKEHKHSFFLTLAHSFPSVASSLYWGDQELESEMWNEMTSYYKDMKVYHKHSGTTHQVSEPARAPSYCADFNNVLECLGWLYAILHPHVFWKFWMPKWAFYLPTIKFLTSDSNSVFSENN